MTTQLERASSAAGFFLAAIKKITVE